MRRTSINKTMDRDDLLTEEAQPLVDDIHRLIQTMYSQDLVMTSWYGGLPEKMPRTRNHRLRSALEDLFGRTPRAVKVGFETRGRDYVALKGAADDARLPWYLYWEIVWVTLNGPRIAPGMRLLDAGGASSLFSCYLASLGCRVHSIDINEALIFNASKIAEGMGWSLFSDVMDMKALDFEAEYFDHAFSICVFEHLDYQTRQAALAAIARCLKPQGTLSITFDYRNPAPFVYGYGNDARPENQLNSPEDVERNFLANGYFELIGNPRFFDNGLSYLVHPKWHQAPYTFGAVFLRKK